LTHKTRDAIIGSSIVPQDMRLLSRTEAVFAQARLRLPIVVKPPSTGQDLSGGTIQGTIGESVLETGGRSGRCSLRNLMASSRGLC
jgi:hypothetical protein